jgi:NIMA (never in mitosis gene a)-related kinase 1/4/5
MDIESMSDEERKEALLEAKIQERLDHPNIIKFREVFMAKKPYFTLNIVMDYADGNYLYLFRW